MRSWSKRMQRVLVVPWSIDAISRGIRMGIIAAGQQPAEASPATGVICLRTLGNALRCGYWPGYVLQTGESLYDGSARRETGPRSHQLFVRREAGREHPDRGDRHPARVH